MYIKTDYDENGQLIITAKIIHHEKDMLIKVMNDIIWIENPDNNPRPAEDAE